MRRWKNATETGLQELVRRQNLRGCDIWSLYLPQVQWEAKSKGAKEEKPISGRSMENSLMKSEEKNRETSL